MQTIAATSTATSSLSIAVLAKMQKLVAHSCERLREMGVSEVDWMNDNEMDRGISWQDGC